MSDVGAIRFIRALSLSEEPLPVPITPSFHIAPDSESDESSPETLPRHALRTMPNYKESVAAHTKRKNGCIAWWDSVRCLGLTSKCFYYMPSYVKALQLSPHVREKISSSFPYMPQRASLNLQ